MLLFLVLTVVAHIVPLAAQLPQFCSAGKCEPMLAVGEKCENNDQCPGRCGWTSDFKSRVCLPASAVGEKCFIDKECPDGTYCRSPFVSEASKDSVCSEPSGLGVRCDPNLPLSCHRDLSCIVDAHRGHAVCATKLQLLDVCSRNRDCVSNNCSLIVSSYKRCTDASTPNVTDVLGSKVKCDPKNETNLCPEGTFCHTFWNKCYSPATLGGYCEEELLPENERRVCGSSGWCRKQSSFESVGHCSLRVPVGGSCDFKNTATCQDGLACVSINADQTIPLKYRTYWCVQPKLNGQNCTQHQGCISGYCGNLGVSGTTPRCGPRDPSLGTVAPPGVPNILVLPPSTWPWPSGIATTVRLKLENPPAGILFYTINGGEKQFWDGTTIREEISLAVGTSHLMHIVVTDKEGNTVTSTKANITLTPTVKLISESGPDTLGVDVISNP